MSTRKELDTICTPVGVEKSQLLDVTLDLSNNVFEAEAELR